jgi:hypothetical protein
MPTYRLHETTGDEVGILGQPVPNVEPGDVVVLTAAREAMVTARLEGGRGSRFEALLEVAVAPLTAESGSE